MEQTIGKRIAANRKRLGMTQDQLAERLGVTAQAVSKWENDQSCPDIATLPRLAEIFGISTDELLGHTTQAPVHEAEVVDSEDCEEEGLHIQKGAWEMKWDGGRHVGLSFAIYVLLVGLLTLADALLAWGVGFWSIAWPSFFLVMGVAGLTKRFAFFNLGSTLFGSYYLLSNLGFIQLDLGNLVFPVILVLFGISLLADSLRRPQKSRFHIARKGNPHNEKTHNDFRTNGEYAEATLSFGEAQRLISLPRLSRGDFTCTFGELVVDLSGCEEIADDCHIEATCSFGELVIKVPKCYRINPDPSIAFANLEERGTPDPEPKGTIRLNASVSFGNIVIRYI